MISQSTKCMAPWKLPGDLVCCWDHKRYVCDIAGFVFQYNKDRQGHLVIMMIVFALILILHVSKLLCNSEISILPVLHQSHDRNITNMLPCCCEFLDKDLCILTYSFSLAISCDNVSLQCVCGLKHRRWTYQRPYGVMTGERSNMAAPQEVTVAAIRSITSEKFI